MYESIVKDVYNYLSHSTTRKVELQLWQTIYSDPVITIKGFSATRWLSVHNSIQSVATSYISLLAFFAIESVESHAARGIYSQLRKWRCAAMTFALEDILGVLTTLSKRFQQDDLPLPCLLAVVKSVRKELTAHYLQSSGPHWGIKYREWYQKH